MKADTHPLVFLDTTVQVLRVLGSAQRRQSAERIVTEAANARTSDYVFVEYQRTVIRDCSHVHRLILQGEDWASAVEQVADGQRAFRPRTVGRVTRILAQAMRCSQFQREKALLFLEARIEYGLRRTFWRHVTRLPDLVICDLIATGPTRQPDDTYAVPASCRKETASCHLPDFLAGKRPELRTVSDYLAAHPGVIKDQERVCRLLPAVLDDPRAALGQAACWPLGDVIVALHVPAGTALWTLDPDFEPLAAALGLALHEPTAEGRPGSSPH